MSNWFSGARPSAVETESVLRTNSRRVIILKSFLGLRGVSAGPRPGNYGRSTKVARTDRAEQMEIYPEVSFVDDPRLGRYKPFSDVCSNPFKLKFACVTAGPWVNSKTKSLLASSSWRVRGNKYSVVMPSLPGTIWACTGWTA